MLFDSTPKIVTNGTAAGIPDWLASAFDGSAQVLLLRATAGGVTLQDSAGVSLDLTNPLPAPTIFVVFPSDADTSVLDTAAALWAEAGLEAPIRLAVENHANSLGSLAAALLELQNAYVQSAARRNVDLLSQIAVLREVTEDQATAFEQAVALLRDREGGARLLYRATPYGPGLDLEPEGRVTQRVPVTVHPRLLGGLTCFAKAPAETSLSLTLWSEELQVALVQQRYDVPKGQSALYLPVVLPEGLAPKLLDLVIENRGFDPVTIDTALCESPDERAMGTDPADFSIRLDLTTATRAEARVLPLKTLDAHQNASASDLANFVKKTPGFDDRNWLKVARNDRLMLHPLPDRTAIASLESLPVTGPAVGLTCTVHLRDKANSIVYACLSVTREKLDLPDLDAVEAFASGVTSHRFDEVARSDWHALMPGTEQEIGLNWANGAAGMSDLVVNVMTTTRGEPTAYANCWFKDLVFVHRN